MAIFRRIANLFRRSRLDREIAEELQAHIELRTDENVANGMSPEAARRDALLRFGNRTALKEHTNGSDAALGLESFWFDLRYALRQLKKSSGFAATVVLTLALGIGANAAMFSVVNAVLRHPAGVDHPEQVVAMHTRYTKFTLDIPFTSTPIFKIAESLSDKVEAAALLQSTSFNILRGGVEEHIAAAKVSHEWFRVFGAQPVLGRTFTAEEDVPNAGPVVVLSYGLWQRAFGGQREVIGKTILLDQKAYRVIGVMRSDFEWPRHYDMWVPIALPPSEFTPDHFFDENFHAMVRLRPGVSIQQFEAVLTTRLWDELRKGGGDRYATSAGWSLYANPLTEFAAGPLRKPLYILSAVVALVLLIASANVAGLFLTRAAARSREFAIQMALGASTGRMVRQLMLETFLLAMVASVAGAGTAPLTGRLLLRLVPHDLATGYRVQIGPELFLFAVGSTLLTLVVAGMGPVYAMLRWRGQVNLREGEKSSTASVGKQRLRNVFVVAEVAAAFLLLTGTGLFLASLFRLQQVDPGFNPRGVIAGTVHFTGEDFKKEQPKQAAFVDSVVNRLAAQPAVQAAAAVEPLPFYPGTVESCSFAIRGRPLGPNDPGPHSQLTYATADYLKVMQIPLLQGRWIDSTDIAGAEPVAVVDARLARKYWPGQSPLGQHISFGCSGRAARVVGVVATIRIDSLEEDTSDGMRYYSFAQSTNPMVEFVVRTETGTAQAESMIRQAVAETDSSQTVSTASSLQMLVLDSLAGRRLIVWMLAAFASLALLLAMIGIYGLVSFATSQRTQEVGIRMALGAQRSSVLRLILGSTLLRVGAGLLIGIALSILVSVFVRHLFPDIGEGMASSLSVATGILLVVGLAAGMIPARRAASIDPMQALRSE